MTFLPWMTEEIKQEMAERERIVENRDIDGLFALADNEDFSIALRDILVNDCTVAYEPQSLNHEKRTLLLCMLLEEASQADTVLTFLQEDYSQYAQEVVAALNEIGARKSAKLIERINALLPEDGEWFFDVADDDEQELPEKPDSEFSHYPDGRLCDLYKKYALLHRQAVAAK